MSEHRVRLEQLLPLLRERLEAGQDVQFTPRGASMLPMLRDGQDCVVLSPVHGTLKKYDLPLYRRPDGRFVLHRIVSVSGQTYTCVGDNQFVLESGVEHGQVIAVVTAFTRKGRRWSTDDALYRFYCRLWHMSRPVRRLWRRGWGKLKRSLKK